MTHLATHAPNRRASNTAGFWIGLCLILVIAAIARFNQIGRASFDVDEYLHVFAAQSLLSTGTPALPSGNSYDRAWPYTAAVAGSFKLFGVNEIAARLPSAVAGLLLVLAVALIGRAWFGAVVGLCAGALVAVSPLSVMTSRLCRMYAPFELLYLLTVFAVGHWVLRPQRPLRRRLLGGALAFFLFGAACLLQRLGEVFLVALAVYIAGLALRRPKSAATLWLGAGVVAAAGLWLSGRAHVRHVWTSMNYAPKWAEHSRYHNDFYWTLWTADFPVLMWLLAAILIWLIFRYRPLSDEGSSGWYPSLGWYLAVMWAVPFALHSLVFDWKFSRYVAHLFAVFALAVSPAIAQSLKWLWHRGQDSFRRGLAARVGLMLALSVVCALLVWPAPARTVFAAPIAASPAWREAYAYVRSHSLPQDAIVTSIPLGAAHYLGRSADYYLDNYAYIDFRRKMKQDAQGRWLDWYSSVPMVANADEFAQAVAEHPRGWVVIDKDRFDAPKATPVEIRSWLEAHARKYDAASDGSVIVYAWGAQ